MKKKVLEKPSRSRALKTVAYAGLLVVALAVGAVAGWIHQSPLVTRIIVDRFRNVPPSEAFGGKDHLTILLLGCDEDLAPGGKKLLRKSARADMLLVANLDFANKRISGLSIPRDLRVKTPGEPAHKMNAFYHNAKPGQEETDQKSAVEFMLPQIHIDKVLSVNFPAFETLVNQVGGVTVAIDKKMDYDDWAGNVHAHFQPGVSHLDGYQAEMFVRFRHSDDDWERQKRQKEFMAAFKNALIRHLSSINRIAEAGKEVFGDALTDGQIASLINFVGSVPQQNIKLGELPSHPGRGTWVLLDKRKVEPALRAFGLIQSDDSQENNR